MSQGIRSIELETMYLEQDDQVARIVFNRPEVLNAGNVQWVEDLGALGRAVSEDPKTRLVVVRGNGRAFCSGIDLNVVSTGAYDPDWFLRWEQAITAFETMEKITIAAIHSYCLGGGLQLALECDVRIARSDAALALPAALEGLIPGVGPYRLARYVGIGRAKYLSLTGEHVSAQEALALGLVDCVAEADGFEAEITRVVKLLLEAPATAQRHTKKIANMAFHLPFAEVFREYLRLQKEAVESPDHAEAAARYCRAKAVRA